MGGRSQLNKMLFLLTSFTSNFCSPVNQPGYRVWRGRGRGEEPERLTTHRGGGGERGGGSDKSPR